MMIMIFVGAWMGRREPGRVPQMTLSLSLFLLATVAAAAAVEYEVTIDGATHGIAYDAPATAVDAL